MIVQHAPTPTPTPTRTTSSLYSRLYFGYSNKNPLNFKSLDEPFDRYNLARPVGNHGSLGDYGGSNSRSSNDAVNDDELIYRNLDGLERTLANAYRLYNLGVELNRKRFYLDRKFNNYNAVHRFVPNGDQQQPQQPQPSQANGVQSKELHAQQNQEFAQDQHQLKRTIDRIGGANLLKRAVDRLGGGNLLKRR